jgi:hypothetical protein
MKRLVAIIGATIVAIAVYLIAWFVVRNMVDGLGQTVEIGGHMLTVFVAVIAGLSSYRSSLAPR